MKLGLNVGRMSRPSRATRAYLITWIVGLILASPVAHAQGKCVKLRPSSEPMDEGEAVGRGVVLNSRLPVLMAPNGWLLQSFNLSNPAVGESVSNVLAVVDAFPIRKAPIFLRVGPGLALYQNNRPGGFGGSGWAWTAGMGYEIPISENLRLAPMVDYAAGSLGDVRNAIAAEMGRRYSVVEFKVAIAWHFGTPN